MIGRAASAAETRAARTACTGRGAAGSGYGQCPRRGGRVGVVASGARLGRVVRGSQSASPPVRPPVVRIADRAPVLIMITRITGVIPEPQLIRITRFACRDMD